MKIIKINNTEFESTWKGGIPQNVRIGYKASINYNIVMVVALLTFDPNGDIFEWAAYIAGATNNLNKEISELEMAEFTAKYGVKLPRHIAVAFFPDLVDKSYRE